MNRSTDNDGSDEDGRESSSRVELARGTGDSVKLSEAEASDDEEYSMNIWAGSGT